MNGNFVFRVVMPPDDGDRRAVSGNLRGEAGHWDRPEARRGSEGVQGRCVADSVEFAGDELSALFQGSRSWRPRTEADQALQVSEGPVAVKLAT